MAKSMNLHADVSPNYEIRLKRGRIGLTIIAVLFSVAEVALFLMFSKEGWSVYGLAIFPLFIVTPIALLVFLRRVKGSEGALFQFINSVSNMVRSWALVGPSVMGQYNAYCEFSEGYYVSLEQDLSYHSGYRAVLLSVSKFINGPEPVSKAPFVKLWFDNYILKFTTTLPFRDEEIESWKKGDEKWKRLVSEDEIIRSWMAQHCNWRNLRYGPTSRGIYSIGMEACHGYRRNPSVRDGWLKGKWLTADFTFRIPTTSDANKLRTFYLEMIDIGKRIIQHIEEGKGLVSSKESGF